MNDSSKFGYRLFNRTIAGDRDSYGVELPVIDVLLQLVRQVVLVVALLCVGFQQHRHVVQCRLAPVAAARDRHEFLGIVVLGKVVDLWNFCAIANLGRGVPRLAVAAAALLPFVALLLLLLVVVVPLLLLLVLVPPLLSFVPVVVAARPAVAVARPAAVLG